ncbi:MAG: membrane dipeptidase [Candidatus Aminicenantia bacterium]
MKLKIKDLFISLLILVLIPTSYLFSQEKIDPQLWQRALKIHKQAIVIDTHCDTPMLMMERNLDIGKRSDKGNLDLIRMKEGGLDASFFVVFLSNELDNKHPTKKALEIIDEIYQQVEKYPDLAEIAYSPQDIRRIHQTGKRAILIGMENGGPIEGSLRLLRDYYRLGVRYITLTHGNNNDICDSSTAENPRWNGLSEFGKEVVKEMNQLGIMIDVSHISDKAFRDVLEVSQAPVIASHSSVRSLCNVPRNMSDEMIKALAKKGGVIQINFYSGFLDEEFNQKYRKARRKMRPEIEKLREKYKDNQTELWNAIIEFSKKYAPPPPKIDTLIDHIDYVVKLVGVDYVGLGSDFDGAGSYPQGLEDVSGYPLITYQLLKRGYKEDDIKKILGGNLLRVFEEVTKTARKLET